MLFTGHRSSFLIAAFTLLCAFSLPTDFKSEQQKFSRVKEAYAEKYSELSNVLKAKKINIGKVEVFLQVIKDEQKLYLWAKERESSTYTLVKTYDFCTNSGTLGPKRRQGDGQIPEGLYTLDRFNPQSNFHLSLGVSYPNTSDKIRGSKNPGGDIFIHGSCVSIGCVSITDDKIKEVYLLCVEARNSGQTRIPVHIFPYRMNDENHTKFLSDYANDKNLCAFWSELKPAFSQFESNKKLPAYRIGSQGNYLIN